MTDAPEELLDIATVAERTALSWQRTVIGIIATGGLAVRWCVVEHFPVWPGIALAVIGAAAGLIVVPRRYRRVLESVRAGRTPLSRYLIPATTAFVAAVVAVMGVGVGIELARL